MMMATVTKKLGNTPMIMTRNMAAKINTKTTTNTITNTTKKIPHTEKKNLSIDADSRTDTILKSVSDLSLFFKVA